MNELLDLFFKRISLAEKQINGEWKVVLKTNQKSYSAKGKSINQVCNKILLRKLCPFQVKLF